MSKASFLDNSLIIAAHPDDELLWFGSILPHVDQVLIVFEDYWPDPSIGPARARALENYPRKNVESLRFSEAATYGLGQWENPVLTSSGMALSNQSHLRDLKQKLRGNRRGAGIKAHYKANADRLYEILKDRLTADMNIFTHNPWGEYGHEEHVQLFRVIDRLREEIGFTLWMSNYCTERALPLAMRYFDNKAHETIELPVDKRFADKVANTYRQAGCWTWSDQWNWFDAEIFMQAPCDTTSPKQQAHLFPLNFFNIDPVY